MFLLITVLFISIGTVTAIDKVSNDTSSNIQITTPPIEQETIQIEESTLNSIEKDTSIQNNNNLKANEEKTYDVTNYQDLCNAIDESNTNQYTSTITLNGQNTDYVINDNNIISVNTNITINGQEITIRRNYDDGNGYSIFNISKGNTLTIKNLILSNNMGSAINNSGTLNIINSTLNDNIAIGTSSENSQGFGGAIYSTNGNVTIIDSALNNNTAKSSGTSNGLYAYGGAIYSTNTNLTIINSKLNNNNAVPLSDVSVLYAYGGAIYHNKGSLTIIDSTLNYNNAKGKGCGGAVSIMDSIFTIVNSTFMNNTVSGDNGVPYGGAIYNTCNGTLINNTFTNNIAEKSSLGGAIYNNGNINLLNNTFINNNATNGAAIYNFGSINIFNSSFDSNRGREGAGIYNQGYISISNVTFINNYVDSYGGAIRTHSDINITNGTFINNTAYGGGGAIDIWKANLNIIDSTFTNNRATYPNILNGHGGAIQNTGDSEKIVNISNTTFTNNSANYGGALDNSGNMIVNDSIFEFNKALLRSGGVCYNKGTLNLTNTTMLDNVAGSGGVCYTTGTLNIFNSTMNRNNATYDGGVVYSVGNTSITNSTFNNNNASYGGVLCTEQEYYSSIRSTIEIINSTFNNNNASYGGVSYNQQTEINIINSTLYNNSANYGGALYQDSNTNLTIKNSIFEDNHVRINTSYVVTFKNVNNVTIIDTHFMNNTDNTRDMLFSDVNENTIVDIHGNNYIDNYLENRIIEPDVTAVTDNESRSYDYDIEVNLREIYNDTVRNGTLNVYVNGLLKDTTEVKNGYARIFFVNKDLTNRENNITFEYITQSKHYQNTTTNFTVKKEINTTLTIQAPSTMKAGDTAVINFTLKDVNNNPLSGETIHVLVDEEQVDTITTDNNGVATYTFNASGDELVRIEATHHTSSDSFYLSAMDVVAEIDVNKIEPEIVIVPGNIIPQVESNVTIHLFDPDGNPIKNKTLTVNITEEGKPDITGTVTTDENGIGVFNFTPTDEGTLNINVTSPSDDIYHYASESVQVSHEFITTNLIVTATSMKINQTNTISVEVLADGTLLNGIVELNIDGENHTLNIYNGRGTYHDYKSETAGEKFVSAKFTSSIPGYANSTTTEEFDVEKLPTRVTIEVINRTVGNVTLKVLVFPENNTESIVNGGNIVIESIAGENRKIIYNDTLVNGELIYLTDVNEIGWNEFATEYHGNDYFYGEINNTGSVELLLVGTGTITFDKTAFVGNTITLNATVNDEDGNPVNEGNVTFHVDGSQLYHADGTPVEGKLENGIVTTEYKLPIIFTKGNYIITANYLGNNKYNTSFGESKLSIETQETNMGVTPVNNTKGNTTIEVTLNNTDDNKPIPDAEIIVKDLDGNQIGEGATDENGTAIIILDLPVGENNITITYLGNETYSPQEKTTTINVTPRESQTRGIIINNTVGNVTIDVQVNDPETGEPVTGQVKIIVDDEIVGTGDLNNEGKATILTDINKKGNYTILVQYEGNDDYYPSDDVLNDVNIVGKEADMNVSSENPTVENTTLNVTLKDTETGEPIPDAPVIVTLPDGTNVTGTTDENGTAIISLDLPSGENNITITYPGGDEYEAQEENITLKVKSYSVVTVDPVEGVVLDNVTFTAIIRDYLDNPVNGGYVVFKVGGKTLRDENGKNLRAYVENGIAKLSYQAESGWIVDSHPNLSVQATFSGTSIALSNTSDTSKVTIYKRNATVEVSAPDDYVNGTLHIDAVVRDQNGSLINDGNIVFKLNGLSLKNENNIGIIAQVENGKVHIDVKLPFAYSAKEYNLTAVYSNKIYNKATGTNTTTLKAIPTYVNATVTIKDEFSKPIVTGQIYNKFNNAILEGTAIINIKFDGISYAKKVKINNGTFTETLEGIPIYKPGTHKVEIAAGANSHYDAVRKTITTKATSKYDVTTVFTSITRNKTTTIVQAKIVDDQNKNVQRDLSVTIKINGKSFLINRTMTNGNVDVLVDTSTLSNRNYTLELVSGANTYYNAGSTKTELPKY